MELTQAEALKYIQLLKNRRYLFTILALIIMSVVVWGSYFLPKIYRAKSTIFIERNVIEDLVKGIAITPSMRARINILRESMLSRSLILNVLRKLDIDTRAKDDKDLEIMIESYKKNTRVNVNRNNLVNISFESRSPTLARDYINSLVSEYVETNIFAKREEAYDATKFLAKQVEFFKEKMDKGEEEIIKFRQQQGIYIEMDERSTIKEIKTYKNEIERVNIRINELNAAKRSVLEQLKKEEPYTVTMYSKKGVEETIKALKTRLNQLLISYTEYYPEVIRVRTKIEALKRQRVADPNALTDVDKDSEVTAANPVHQMLKQKMIEVDSEIDALKAKKAQILKITHRKKEELKNIPESRKKLTDLVKQKDSYRNVYERLLVRLGQSEVSKQMEIEDKATTFRIIEPAILPRIPVSPNRKMLILAGIVFGFLGGFGIIFLLDNMDNSVKTLDTLKTLGLPVLAIIPHIQSNEDIIKRRKKDILIYSIAGLYMLCIIGVLAMEFLGLTHVEEFISNIVVKQNL